MHNTSQVSSPAERELRFPNAIVNLRLVKEPAGDYCAEPIIDHPASIVDYMRGAFAAFPDQEHFYVVLLNRRSRAIGRVLCTVGTVSGCLASPVIVYRAAILAAATAIVCVHNHPSGDPMPSPQDMAITRLLREASKTIDIALHDHVVIGAPAADPAGLGYYSFRQNGYL